MSSMDNLRNKLRGQNSETDELNETVLSGFGFDTPPVEEARGTTQLPSTAELSESILAKAQSDTDILFQDINLDEPEADFQAKKKRRLPFVEKLDALEINKKMLSISLGVAALASFLATSYIQSGYLDVAGQNKMIDVVVLTQDIPARTKLTRDMLEVKKVPSSYIPKGAIHYDPNNKILDKMTVTKLYKGELLHTERISHPDNRTGITGVIPKGHKAIPLKTDNAYLMKPNDYVDIIVSIPDPNPGSKKIVSIPIMQRAQLIAVGQQYSEEAETNGKPREITVAVPNDKVNLMSILEQKGNFKVVLRSRDDKSILPEKYTIQEIEDALMGRLNTAKVEPKKEEPKKVAKKEEPKKEASDKEVKKVLKDLSTPKQTYSAPRRTYTAPRRTYTPPRRTYTPPKRAYTPPAPRRAPVRRAPVRRAPVVINGGNCTQGC